MSSRLRSALVALALGASLPVSAQTPEPDPEESASASESASESESASASESESESESEVVPPRVLSSTPIVYPQGATGDAEVLVAVTLDATGAVTEVAVERSAGEPFDAAALETVRGWTFAPATRGGEPVAVRVPVAVRFRMPVEPEADSDTATDAENRLPTPTSDSENRGPTPNADAENRLPTPTSDSENRGPTPNADTESRAPTPRTDSEDSFGATAEVRAAELRRQERAASDFEVGSDVLRAAPRDEGADLLSSAPGFYVARPAGAAIAHRILVRGFDAAHGQDLAVDVGGLPINLPSHIHGQGYADLGFVIPSVVRSLRVTEGVHDPRQGDFAVAGSVHFDLAVEERGFRSESSYGSFQTFRQLALWAPEDAPDETFGAVQIQRSDGFGQNRGSLGASAIVQVATPRGGGGWRFRGLGFVNAARADSAGALRVDDVDAGRVGFHDVYDFPTARAQNAANARMMVGVFGERRYASGANAEVGVFLGADLFRAQQNFTGFLQESRTLEDVAGRGDLIEQRNRTTTLGLRSSYRSPKAQPWSWLEARVELGVQARLDWITQEQNLLDASVRNQTWDERVDADVFGTDVGVYGDVEVELAERATLSVGARADVLLYEVDDRLGNFVPASRPDDSFIPGFRRSALGVAGGPRASLSVEATEGLTFMAAYGEGFRSPQARLLEDGERAPFTKVRSADLGLRARWDDRLVVTLAGYWTRLSDDVAFDPEEGALRRIAATRRLGAVAHVEARPVRWLVAAGSVTYVDAELLDPPPATAEEPNPPFEEGQNLPYVPPVVIRLDLGADGPLGELKGGEVSGRVGVGFSYLSPRPLPYGFSADPVALLDASAAVSWGPVELGLSVFNLIGSDYAAFELFYVSDWSGGGVRSRVPARHRMAGSPRTIMGTVGLSW